MNCEKTRDLISPYIDKELNKAQMESVKEHIDSCEECRKEYEMLLNMRSALGALPAVTLPAAFDGQLHASLAAAKQTTAAAAASLSAGAKGIIVAAAVTSVGVLSIIGYNGIVNNDIPDDQNVVISDEDQNIIEDDEIDKDDDLISDADADSDQNTELYSNAGSNGSLTDQGDNTDTITEGDGLPPIVNPPPVDPPPDVTTPPPPSNINKYHDAYYRYLIIQRLRGYEYSITRLENSGVDYHARVSITKDLYGNEMSYVFEVIGNRGHLYPDPSGWDLPRWGSENPDL